MALTSREGGITNSVFSGECPALFKSRRCNWQQAFMSPCAQSFVARSSSSARYFFMDFWDDGTLLPDDMDDLNTCGVSV